MAAGSDGNVYILEADEGTIAKLNTSCSVLAQVNVANNELGHYFTHDVNGLVLQWLLPGPSRYHVPGNWPVPVREQRV